MLGMMCRLLTWCNCSRLLLTSTPPPSGASSSKPPIRQTQMFSGSAKALKGYVLPVPPSLLTQFLACPLFLFHPTPSSCPFPPILLTAFSSTTLPAKETPTTLPCPPLPPSQFGACLNFLGCDHVQCMTCVFQAMRICSQVAGYCSCKERSHLMATQYVRLFLFSPCSYLMFVWNTPKQNA